MVGQLMVDFEPGHANVTRILQLIETSGMPMCGLRLIPSCTERWTLKIDLGGCRSRDLLFALEEQLRDLKPTIDVIHLAPRGPRLTVAA